METVVGDISGAIHQIKNLSDVRLKGCCDELTRGVVEGLWRKQTPQHEVSSSPGKSNTHSLVHLSSTCVHVHIINIMSVLISIYTNHTSSYRMLTYHLPEYITCFNISCLLPCMLVYAINDCVFNVSSVKNVDCGILSWTLYLNLMVHCH